MLRCRNTVKEDVTGRKYCIVLCSEMDNGFVACLGKHLILFLRDKFCLEQRLRRFTNNSTSPLKPALIKCGQLLTAQHSSWHIYYPFC